MSADAYDAAYFGCVLFDLTGQGLGEVIGPEAASFLHNLCTNDIRNLPPGRTVEAFFATAKGRALAHVHVSHVAQDRFLVQILGSPGVDAGLGGKLHAHLDRHLISERVELADRTGSMGVLRLLGPRAGQVVRELTSIEGNDLPDLDVREGQDLLVRRVDEVLPGFDVLLPSERVEQAIARCLELGAVPGDDATFEVLRVEAGTPAWGKEIDDDRLVMEVNRGARAISYTKGCYLGQETIVMARDRGQVNRLLLGLAAEGEEPLAPGAKLMHQDQEAGLATSSAWSHRLQRMVGLGYVKRGLQQEGTVLTAVPPAEGRPVRVVALPHGG